MQRNLRILGALLLLVGLGIAATSLALQFDDGLAGSLAANSTCNYEPCTAGQLQSMTRIVGPVCFLALGGFGFVLLKARVTTAPPPTPDGDVGERLRSLDQLRAQNGITAGEYAEQRRRVLDSV